MQNGAGTGCRIGARNQSVRLFVRAMDRKRCGLWRGALTKGGNDTSLWIYPSRQTWVSLVGRKEEEEEETELIPRQQTNGHCAKSKTRIAFRKGGGTVVPTLVCVLCYTIRYYSILSRFVGFRYRLVTISSLFVPYHIESKRIESIQPSDIWTDQKGHDPE